MKHHTFVIALDSKKTHEQNPDCPQHLYTPDGHTWRCLECGLSIMFKSIPVELEVKEEVPG
jgi:hypothetical protein